MLPLRFAGRWRAASVVLLIIVLAAAVLPAVWMWPDRARLGNWFRDLDKWTHAVTFLVLALWFSGQYRPRAYWRIAVGLIMFGVLIELVQRSIRYRSAEWLDIGADVLGIAIGLGIALAGVGGWCLRVEAWLARRA